MRTLPETQLICPVTRRRLRRVEDYIAARAPLVAEGRKVVVDRKAADRLLVQALYATSFFARIFLRKRKTRLTAEKIGQLKQALRHQFNEAAGTLPFDARELEKEAAAPKRTIIMASPEKISRGYHPDDKLSMFTAWFCIRHALVKAGAHLETMNTSPNAGGFREVYTRDRYVMVNGTAYLPDPQRIYDMDHWQANVYAGEIQQARKELARRGVKTQIVEDAWFEGGNVIRHFGSRTIFVGIYGEWSSPASAQKLLDAINANEQQPWKVVNVPLTNYEQMYHMDTGMSEELPHGEVMISPRLTDPETYKKICRIVGQKNVIELDQAQAALMATNFMNVGDTLVMTGQLDGLKKALTTRGYNVVIPGDYQQPTFEFGRGGVHCMTNDVPQAAKAYPARHRQPAGLAPR